MELKNVLGKKTIVIVKELISTEAQQS